MDSDRRLAARLARDLDAAFPDLVAVHADRLYTIALRLLGDRRDAEEVAQDALVAAHRAMAGYEPARIADLRLRPWLASIAVNLARNRRRRHVDRHPPESLEPLAEAGFDPRDDAVPDPSGSALQRESAAELGALLLRLPASVRVAIVLRHVDGLSVAETASALGRPEGTVKAQVSRGLARLRVMLDAEPPGASSTALRRSPSSAPHADRPRGLAFAASEVLP
jgi:RNA polymerase sigma-70 factor (ECF subfamily)